MNDHELRSGKSPDFAMTSGKIVYFHRAELKFSRPHDKSKRLALSHGSLIMLLRCIHGKLKAISGPHQFKIDWVVGQALEGIVMNEGPLFRVIFRFPYITSQSQRSILSGKIQDFFEEYS